MSSNTQPKECVSMIKGDKFAIEDRTFGEISHEQGDKPIEKQMKEMSKNPPPAHILLKMLYDIIPSHVEDLGDFVIGFDECEGKFDLKTADEWETDTWKWNIDEGDWDNEIREWLIDYINSNKCLPDGLADHLDYAEQQRKADATQRE